MSDQTTSNTGESAFADAQQAASPEPILQDAEAANAPPQGKGRGGKKGRSRGVPMALSHDAYSTVGIPSQNSRNAGRPRGNASQSSGNRQQNQQRIMESRVTTPAFAPPQPQEHQVNRVPKYVPGAEPVAGWSTNAESTNDESVPAPSGKRNRRHRGGKRPAREPTSFKSLPFELRERILVDAYQMTLDDQPESGVYVTNKPLDMSRNAQTIRYHRRHLPAETVLQNHVLPEGLNARQRKAFLWKNPGQWGPIFQVMYSCKQMYEEGKAVRYREIRANAGNFIRDAESNDNVLINRLSYQTIRDCTQRVIVEIYHRQDTVFIQNLVTALRNITNLKHVCVLVKCDDAWTLNERKGADKDLLLFFNLKIDTLTICWSWASYSDPNDWRMEPDEFTAPDGTTYISSVAEIRQQDCQVAFFKQTYEPSSWYTGPATPDDGEMILKAQPGTVIKHIRKSCGDQFYFAQGEDRVPTGCPNWVLHPRNPRNHPDQFKRPPKPTTTTGIDPDNQDSESAEVNAEEGETNGEKATSGKDN